MRQHVGACGWHSIATRGTWNARGQTPTQALAEQAIERATAPEASFSEALTGAGAVINLLNEASQTAAGIDAPTAVRCWGILEQCLNRYRSLRQAAVSDGWWNGIPELRREELDGHLEVLERIETGFRDQLISKGFIQPTGVKVPTAPHSTTQ
jgi:hypothetical protein